MPIGLTNVSARNSRNTPTFSNHRSINSPGEIKSSLLAVGGDTHQKNVKENRGDKKDPFPWWSRAHNGTLGEISPATLKAFKHGCLCTLKKRRNGLICVLITAMCGGRFYGVQ